MTASEAPRIGGRYEIQQLLGRGGMATVHRALDPQLGRAVAVKVMRPDFAQDDVFEARFVNEARNAASISHPNVVTVLDFGTEGPGPYIVMELVEGGDLSALITREAPLAPHRAAFVAAEVASALQAAHAHGIVHRDVKPGNILIAADGHPRVADFGIARATGEQSLTSTGSSLGSVDYFSPEQARGEPATAASDIYALGVVLYEMLTGKRPFTGDTQYAIAVARLDAPPPDPRAVKPDVPKPLAAVVQRAMATDPHARFGSAADMARALETWLARNPAPAADEDAGAAVAAAAVAGSVAAPAAAKRPRVAQAGGPKDATSVVPVAAPPKKKRATGAAAAPAAALAAGAATAGAAAAAAAASKPASAADMQDTAPIPTPVRGRRAKVAPPAQVVPVAAVAPASRAVPASVAPVGAAAAAPPVTVEPVAIDDDSRRRRSPLLLAVAAVLLLAVIGFVGGRFLAGGDDPTGVVVGTPRGAVLDATPEATESPTPEPTERATPEPTRSPTPSPTQAPTPPPVAAATPAPAAPAPPQETPIVVAMAVTPDQTVATWYSYVVDGQFDAAYAMWSDRMKANFGRQGNLDNRWDDTASISINQMSVTSMTNSYANVYIDFVETSDNGSTRRFIGSWDLVRSGDGWLLDNPNF